LYRPFDLTGKTCLVTGGSRGIGFAVAQSLAQAGANIAIWSWDNQKASSAAEKLRLCGRPVVARHVDVRSSEQIDEGLEDLLATFPRLDAVFAFAGAPQALAILGETTPEQYREMMAVHADGTFFTLKAVCRQFERQAREGRPGGSIVGCSSLAAHFGAPLLHAYGAAKAAIPAMIRSVAVEMARYGVRANTVVPGWIETELSRDLRERVSEHVLRRIPARRVGQPEEIGGIAVYLASDASVYHSGDTIVIDGAYSVA
jgi:NAD(P)-dependent dehydrogenase (short-subunit alcohol dehydrogenase family)